jgi:hypothetical protein
MGFNIDPTTVVIIDDSTYQVVQIKTKTELNWKLLLPKLR